jgi:hypothetical protein
MAKLALGVRSSPEDELPPRSSKVERTGDQPSAPAGEHRIPGAVGVLIVSAVSVALWAAILNVGLRLFH